MARKTKTKIRVNLPEYHPGQQRIVDNLTRFSVICTGRQWGKTTLLVRIAVEHMLAGKKVGLWLPTLGEYLEPYWERFMEVIPKELIVKASTQSHAIRLINGASLHIFTCEKKRAGQGHTLDLALVDEAATVKDILEKWNKIIMPTLAIRGGTAILTSTPNGRDGFWQLSELRHTNPLWSLHHAPTFDTPYLLDEERAIYLALPRENSIVRQEYYAEFIEAGGSVYPPQLVWEPNEIDYDAYVRIGIDLAKMSDYTVVSIWDDQNRQLAMHRWNQQSWEAIVDKIVSILTRWRNADVIIDGTGVGNPVCDQIEEKLPSLTFERFIFTQTSRNRILENLALHMDDKNCCWLDDDIQKSELEGFRRLMRNGRVVLECSAPHDDTVMAGAMALSLNIPQVYQGLLN